MSQLLVMADNQIERHAVAESFGLGGRLLEKAKFNQS